MDIFEIFLLILNVHCQGKENIFFIRMSLRNIAQTKKSIFSILKKV